MLAIFFPHMKLTQLLETQSSKTLRPWYADYIFRMHIKIYTLHHLAHESLLRNTTLGSHDPVIHGSLNSTVPWPLPVLIPLLECPCLSSHVSAPTCLQDSVWASCSWTPTEGVPPLHAHNPQRIPWPQQWPLGVSLLLSRTRERVLFHRTALGIQ